MAYATSQDITDYTGIINLPDDIERQINRAEELIEETTRGMIDTDNESHITAAKKATCAQIEYWLSNGEEVDVSNMPHNFSIGSFSMGSGNSNKSNITKLAPRARRHLFMAGLLYSGVGVK